MERHYNRIAGQSLEHRRHLSLAAALCDRAPDSPAVWTIKDPHNENGRPKGPAECRDAMGFGGYFRTGLTWRALSPDR